MGLYSDLQFDNGQYIPQYAGAPLNEIQNTASTLAERHYGNLANASNLQILANQLKSELLPGAKSHVDTHINALQGALEDMAQQGGENSTARINALANALKGDQGILNAGKRASEYKKQTELIDNLTAQGHQPVYNKARRQALENASVTSDVYNTPYSALVEPYKDPTKDWEELMTKIKPDKSLVQDLSLDKANNVTMLKQALANGEIDMPIFLKEVQRLGVSKEKIKGLKESLISSYKNMASYSQQRNANLGDGFGKSDDQITNELMKYSMLYQYQQDDTGYHAIPRTGLGAKGKQTTPNPYPTLAPAQTVESLFDYGDSGQVKSIDGYFPQNQPEERKMLTPEEMAAKKNKDANPEYSKQYLNDYRAMAEIRGQDGDIKPGSKEAQALAKEYKGLVEKRVSNPWIYPTTQDNIADAEKDLARQYPFREYMDPATGKTVTAFDNNNEPTDEFIELTGGDPSKFKIGAIYDAKNHFTGFPGGNEKFINALEVVGEDKDGKLKRFIASQPPKYTPPVDINTNVIYNKVNMRPGQTIDINPRVKARELHGAQLQNLVKDGSITPEDMSRMTMPIEATVDNETLLFDSPEHLSQYLLSKGIQLKVK